MRDRATGPAVTRARGFARAYERADGEERVRGRTWTEFRNAGLMALVTLMALGCFTTSWDTVRSKDTVAGYNRYLRANPHSWHSNEARERIAYIRVRNHPSMAGYYRFVENHPESELLPELRTDVEPLYFEQARKANTPAAYRSFLTQYGSGSMAAKARGNLSYVVSVRDTLTAANLQHFIEKHPESDFIEEARSSLALLERYQQTKIRRLGVYVEVAPNVGQRARVRNGFGALVAHHYNELGVEVVAIRTAEAPPPGTDAWMHIEYKEAPAAGTFGGRTTLSQCRIRLYHRGLELPVWDRSFEAPADHILIGAYGRDKSVFANATYRFWNEFFVPVSTWASSQARLHHMEYSEDVSAIDVRGDRAALLYSKGGIDYLDISKPLEPKTLQRYRRGRDLTRWTDVKLLSDKLILSYGPDGIELVEIGEVQAKRIAQFELPEVGSIASADLLGSTLLFAGTQGVFALRLEKRPLRPQPLLDGKFIGLFVRKPYVYLVRPEQLELTSPKHLLQHMTGAKLKLPENFGGHKVRVAGNSMFVMGKEDIIEIRIPKNESPKIVGNLPSDKIGTLNDMTSDGSHLYLLGQRGLGVAGSSAESVSDFIQVQADRALSRKGRFLFLVGNRSLEVLDMAPYQAAMANPRD